jgi:hypothetical protein
LIGLAESSLQPVAASMIKALMIASAFEILVVGFMVFPPVYVL